MLKPPIERRAERIHDPIQRLRFLRQEMAESYLAEPKPNPVRIAKHTGWFALVLIRNNRDVLQEHNLPVAFAEPFILFAVFGVLSVLFWLYFRLRPSPENAAQDASIPEATPPGRPAVTSPDLARPAGDVAEAETATGRGQ